jgi:hypothetical protein
MFREVAGMIEGDGQLLWRSRIQAGPQDEKSDEDLVECAEWPTQKMSPDLRGSWEVPGALVYLETEKLVFAVADWLPLTALAVS